MATLSVMLSFANPKDMSHQKEKVCMRCMNNSSGNCGNHSYNETVTVRMPTSPSNKQEPYYNRNNRGKT